MRVAICINDLSGGGAERTCLRMAQGLIARGHELDFLLMRPRIHYPGEVPAGARLFVLDMEPEEKTRKISAHHLERCISPVPEARTISRVKDCLRLVHALRWGLSSWARSGMHPVDSPRRMFSALPRGDWPRRARFVASYVSREKPDCVLSSLATCTMATLWATSLLRKFPPVIPTIHNQLGHARNRTRTRYRRLLQYSAHVVAVSDGVRNEVLELTGVSAGKASTIYNPVVTPELDALKQKAPEHPWLTDGGPPVVLAAGRLHKVKDYPTMLRAFHELAKNRELRLVILGEGERREELEACVRLLGLEDRVSLPGWTANPFAFMSRAALFVLSSKREGLGNVLIEALACGCPVVSTDCPYGPSEILEGGRFGPLVPVGDHVALADAMGRVLDNPPDKEMLMRRAAFFSADRAVDAYEKLIVETVRKHRAAPGNEAGAERRG